MRRCILRVPHHVDAGQLADRLEEDLDRLTVHLEADGFGVERLELGDGQHAVDLVLDLFLGLIRRRQGSLLGGGLLAGLFHPFALALDHLLGAPDLLYGNGGAGVDGITLLEFEESLPQQALVAGLQPFIDVPLSGLEAGLLGGHLVDHVGGVLGKGLFVRLQGGIPLLLGFA